jgi:hypothetical protein|tara:strand:+ start:1009 stop:1173 length:165 start_codon:yes stop_codon:yes gene_type:complete
MISVAKPIVRLSHKTTFPNIRTIIPGGGNLLPKYYLALNQKNEYPHNLWIILAF